MFWLWGILSILISSVAGFISYKADVKRAVTYPWAPAILRGTTIFLVLLLIIAPTFTTNVTETRKPIVLFLQDNSQSVKDALGEGLPKYQEEVSSLLQDLSDDYKVVTWNLNGDIKKDSLFQFTNSSTDISDAISKVQEYYCTQNLGATILASDGLYNQSINPLYNKSAIKGSLYTIGVGDTTTQKDIRISKTYNNSTATTNSNFEVRVDIIADKCVNYSNNIKLSENGKTIATAPIRIRSSRYDQTLSFNIKAQKAGLHHYTIELPQAQDEKNIFNNKKDFFVEVIDQQKHILIAGASPHPDIKAIKDALSDLNNYKVTVRVNNDFPSLLDEYDILILHQLPGIRYQSNPTIINSNLPKWIILGNSSHNSSLGSIEKPTLLNIKPQATRSVYSKFNATFSLFNTPKNIRAVIEQLPPLNIPTGKIELHPKAQTLLTDKNNNDLPLWAFLQNKIPTAITSGLGIWRWRMYEYKNFNNTDITDHCIQQTVAFLATDNNKDAFKVTMPKHIWSDQESIQLNAYLHNANNEPVNTPDVHISISSNNNAQEYTFVRHGANYQLNTGVLEGGTYNYIATTKYNNQTLTAKGSFVIESLPLELMQSGADYSMLYTLAEQNNGGFFTQSNFTALKDSIEKNPNIKPVLEQNVESITLIDKKWLFLLILIFAVAEWLLRKYWLAQ